MNFRAVGWALCPPFLCLNDDNNQSHGRCSVSIILRDDGYDAMVGIKPTLQIAAAHCPKVFAAAYPDAKPQGQVHFSAGTNVDPRRQVG